MAKVTIPEWDQHTKSYIVITTCTETIYNQMARYNCGRKAVEGTNPPRCKIHCPEAVAKRRAKSAAQYKKHQAAFNRELNIKIAQQKVIDAAREAALLHPDDLPFDSICTAIAELDAAEATPSS